MDRLIAGAVDLIGARVAYANANGLSPRVGATYRSTKAPWRKVWHTMEAPEDDPDTRADEGWELDQIRSYIIRHRTPPHLWALPKHDVVYQTVPLTFSAYALRHNSGDPETNHAHAIQTEVIGYANNGLTDPDLCDWLGQRVLAPIIAAGVPINLGIAAPSTGSDGYGAGGRVRMTWQQWAGFNGQCGHANVPGNSHWDPGRADYLRIARAAGSPTRPPVPTEDDDMFLIRLEGNPAHALVGPGYFHNLGKTEIDLAKSIGIPVKGTVDRAGWELAREVFTAGTGPQTTMQNAVTNVLKWYAATGEGPLHDIIGDTDSVDEAEVARLVLDGLDPAAIASAIPDDLADKVADELGARLAG